ncbi:MAG: hypothetical protein JSW28_09010 [Thermoplasmata archaeon]|nr:MAG: hypothetical protein JSW28_09010 [Thermoplasmata archaeon]
MKQEPDLFYFLQCSTVAQPKGENWLLRVKEEKYALLKYMQYLDYMEKAENEERWFSIRPIGEDAIRWEGVVRAEGKNYLIELVLKDAYPYTPPVARIPELMRYTDRKLEDNMLGLKICDMHMETNYWWNEHCSLALYLKREVSYWLQSVVFHLRQKGWLEWTKSIND